MTNAHQDDLAGRILDTALDTASHCGWDALHLHDIARIMNISLADIHVHYKQKDDIAEAWFDRADHALLALPATPGWDALSYRERLFTVIITWLTTLASHRRLTASMLGYKLHPEHIHLQARGVERISRTVQWIREAAALPSSGLRREIEEASLTTIYLVTLSRWLRDDSPDAKHTRELLDQCLSTAERAALLVDDWLPGPSNRS